VPANATYEQVPGAAGHLPDLKYAPYEERLAYTKDPRASWRGEGGKDALYSGFGKRAKPTTDAQGMFLNPKRRAEAKMLQDYEWARKTGQPVREDIQNFRRILAEGGLEGLKKALQEGAILPSAAIVGISELLYGSEHGQTGNQTP